MKFKKLAEVFDRLEQLSGRIEMSKVLAELFKQTNPEEAKYIVYFINGKLGAYNSLDLGIGEKTIIEALALSTGYLKNEVERLYLEKGDLGIVGFELTNKRKQMIMIKEELEVLEVIEILKEIANKEGEGSKEQKIRLLQRLFNLDPIEVKYIARFLNGQLRLGVGEPTIIDALSYSITGTKEKKEEIERAFNLSSDLGEIAKELLEHKSIEAKIILFRPIRPALAERLSNAKEIFNKIGICAIEYKYDGFRMQIHKKDNKVKIFSRRLEDITYMFPDIEEEAKKIKGDIIFEGEALAFNKENNRFYSFQETMQRRRKYGIEKASEKLPLQLFVFDVMYYNKELVDLPFRKRREVLETIFPRGLLNKSEYRIAKNPEDIEKMFNEAERKKLEGIMAKDLNAPYTAGKRKFAWIKLKKSYQNIDTIDAIIVGYYKGKGSRAKIGFGGLLVAVYNPERDMLETIAKIGSGFSEEDMKIFADMLEKYKIDKKPNNVDANIEPDYWVLPRYVVEVGYDEITKSPVHTCGAYEGKGYALRFPRLIRIRDDKGVEEATTTQEIEELYGIY